MIWFILIAIFTIVYAICAFKVFLEEYPFITILLIVLAIGILYFAYSNNIFDISAWFLYWYVIILCIITAVLVAVMEKKKSNTSEQSTNVTNRLTESKDILITPDYSEIIKMANRELLPRQNEKNIIPEGFGIDENNLPYVLNREYGYGKRFNTFVTKYSECYHRSKCPSIRFHEKTVIHRYKAMQIYRPCSICKPIYHIDGWYKNYIENNQSKIIGSSTLAELPELTTNSEIDVEDLAKLKQLVKKYSEDNSLNKR